VEKKINDNITVIITPNPPDKGGNMPTWDITSAQKTILRNKGKIDYDGKLIYISNPGNKLLGAIDFLVHYCEYKWIKEKD